MNMKFSVLIGNVLLIGLIVLITAVGVNKVAVLDDKMTVINDKNSVKQRFAINFRGSVHDRAISIRDVVLSDNSQGVQKAISEIRTLENFYADSAGPLDDLMADESSASERQILNDIKRVEQSTLPLVTQIIQLINSGQQENAKSILMNQASPAFSEWLRVINQYIDYQEEQNKSETSFVRNAIGDFSGMMLGVTGIAVLIGVAITWLNLHLIARQLGGEPKYIASQLKRMAQGDLTLKLPKSTQGSVLHSLCKLQAKLHSTVVGINSAAEGIETRHRGADSDSEGLVELSNKQYSYSDRANSDLQGVRAEANTISDLLIRTTENSNSSLESSVKGVKAVDTASSEINKVLETVSHAVENIRKLEKRTQEIGGITNTISGISEQTNLLALNAAIEAARAGESGRGFAVVADEVRSLAKRTGVATSEIESMLNEVREETNSTMAIMDSSLPQIEKGIELSKESTNLLREIERTARESMGNVLEVVDASKKQFSLLEDLYNSMGSVVSTSDEIGNTSKELYTQSQQSCASLGEMANDLKSKAAYFNV